MYGAKVALNQYIQYHSYRIPIHFSAQNTIRQSDYIAFSEISRRKGKKYEEVTIKQKQNFLSGIKMFCAYTF